MAHHSPHETPSPGPLGHPLPQGEREVLEPANPSPLAGEGGAQRRERGYNPVSLKQAKRLRKSMTEAEVVLWRHLRAHRFSGYKFRRQQPFNHYITDFISHQAKLVVELDGGHHADEITRSHDIARTAHIERAGYRVLRFWNVQALQETASVLEQIYNSLINPSPGPLGHPLPQGERGVLEQKHD